MNKRFIYFSQKAKTTSTSPASDLVAFIEDTKEILTHGGTYAGNIGTNNKITLGGTSITPVKLNLSTNSDTAVAYDPFGTETNLIIKDGTCISASSVKTTPDSKVAQTITINHDDILTDATSFANALGKKIDTITVTKLGHVSGVTFKDIIYEDLPYAKITTTTIEGGSSTTTSTPGIVNIGTNINLGNDGLISVNTASTEKLGVVKIGDGLSIDANGILSSASSPKLQNTTAIGSINLPVYFTASGVPAVITSLSVAYGGTGQTSLESGKALIGNGTNAVNFRDITNNTSVNSITANTNLITANTLANWSGAYNSTGASNITNVGTITTGTWLGTAIANDYLANHKITIAGTDVVLGGSINASDLISSLGISQAMHWKGLSSTEITNGGTQSPTINSITIATTDLKQGDVVLYGSLEFGWDGTKWIQLGQDGSFKVLQTAVENNPTPESTVTNTLFVLQVLLNKNGDISVTRAYLPDFLDKSVGGTVKGNIILLSDSNPSPYLIFLRGTDGDGLIDYRMTNNLGSFCIQLGSPVDSATTNTWSNVFSISSDLTGKIGENTILTSANYTSYVNSTNFPILGHSHSEYVTALGTSDNYLTWTKNGSTNNITVPYATNCDTVDGKDISDFYHGNVNMSVSASATSLWVKIASTTIPYNKLSDGTYTSWAQYRTVMAAAGRSVYGLITISAESVGYYPNYVFNIYCSSSIPSTSLYGVVTHDDSNYKLTFDVYAYINVWNTTAFTALIRNNGFSYPMSTVTDADRPVAATGVDIVNVKCDVTSDGNIATATKATQDGDGNVISSTYLKLSGGTLTGNLNIGTTDDTYRCLSLGDLDGYNIRLHNAGRGLNNTRSGEICFYDNTTAIGALGITSAGVPYYADDKNSEIYNLIHSGNISSQTVASATKATQDGDGNTISSTYLKLSGGTMTGLIVTKTTSGINFPNQTNYGHRATTYTTGNYIHSGEDNASYDGSNIQIGTWYGFGIYPTISGATRTQGKNSFWHNARTGCTYTVGDFYKVASDGTTFTKVSYEGHTHSYLPLSGGTMANTDVVTNMNADLLDGLHSSSFVLDSGGSYAGTIYDIPSKRVFSGQSLSDAPVTGWVSGIALGSNWNNDHYQHYIIEAGNALYHTRSYSNGAMTGWRTIIDSGNISSQTVASAGTCTGNSATATKLADTATKTAWGQTYWSGGQPQTITGAMTGVTSVDGFVYYDTEKSLVGIGTTSPTYKLDVNGMGCFSPYGVCIRRHSDSGVAFSIYNIKDTNGYCFNASGGGGYFIFQTNNGSSISERVRIAASGNVGIDTSSPSYKLDVNGYIHCTDGFAESSDIRFKDIKETIDLNIEDIANLPIIKYTWKNREDDTLHIGSSALAVEKIIPELVSGEEFKSLNYATLGVIGSITACRKIKELETKIKELEEKLNG